jgi:hypothetical protein
MLCFSTRLSLFNIRDASAFVIKGRHALVWPISDYASKGRRVLPGACLLLAMKVGASPILYKVRRALEWRISFLYPPYNTRSRLEQNSGGARSCPVLTISFPFWTHPSKILVVTKYNSSKG